MAVAGEGHGVRKLSEDFAAVGIATTDARGRSGEWIVSKDEERFLGVERRAVCGEPRLRLLEASLAVLPFGADEIVSFHRPATDLREGFVERLLPALLHAELHERLLLRVALHMHVERHVAVPVAIVVVVAGTEELLHPAAIRRAVVGEHAVPGIRHVLQSAPQTPVAQIARDDHRIDLAVAEILKRPAEHRRRFRRGDMDVADHAK